jgi:hypothetical protein
MYGFATATTEPSMPTITTARDTTTSVSHGFPRSRAGAAISVMTSVNVGSLLAGR